MAIVSIVNSLLFREKAIKLLISSVFIFPLTRKIENGNTQFGFLSDIAGTGKTNVIIRWKVKSY